MCACVRACVTWTSVFNLWISIPTVFPSRFCSRVSCWFLLSDVAISLPAALRRFSSSAPTTFDTDGGATVPSDAGLRNQSRPQPGGRASRPSETLHSDFWIFFLSFPTSATQTVRTAPKAQCDWRKESLHSRVGSRFFIK